MAESKGSLLAKSVQKHAGRAKEKILRNLGKVDQTADDIFDEHLQNFTQQQAISSRLQKEFNNYIRCVRAMQTASKSLIDVLSEIYETNWADRDQFCSQLQNIEILWHDYGHKLADQVLIPMNTYQSQFPEMKKKIDKRGRKLVDYDSQRHHFQSIQQMGKKRDEVKILRAKEQLEEAKRTYELLNSELHDELPALYDSRILFTMTNLQTLFSTEQVFHSETAKVYGELEAIVDKLAMDNQRSPFIAKIKSTNGNGIVQKFDNHNLNNNNSNHNNDVNHLETSTVSVPSEATVDGLPEGVYYKVKALFAYEKEDSDELSFDFGDTLHVVDYDDPDQQEEGWLMGVRELTNERGMFPANFTKPI